MTMSTISAQSAAARDISGGAPALATAADEDAAVALTLNSRGTIRDCSGNSETLFNSIHPT